MSQFYNLIKYTQTGRGFLQELQAYDQNPNDIHPIREHMKEASECSPDLLFPDPDLKSMMEVFTDLTTDPHVVDAFIPLKEPMLSAQYGSRSTIRYQFNEDSVENGSSSINVLGNTDGIPTLMTEVVYPTMFDYNVGNNSSAQFLIPSNAVDFCTVATGGIYQFNGQINLGILPTSYIDDYTSLPITFLNSTQETYFNYRVNLYQYSSDVDPDGNFENDIVTCHTLAVGAFSGSNILKLARKARGFSITLRAHQGDKFRLGIERGKTIAWYDSTIQESLRLVKKVDLSSSNPTRDTSNYMDVICLVNA